MEKFGQKDKAVLAVASRFYLTSSSPSIFLVFITKDHNYFTPDVKNFLILSMLILFATICSCQKQDSAAEQQLAQRKVELDTREKALDERINALNEKVNVLDRRVKALADNQKAMANTGTSSANVQEQTSDPAQEQERRERIQQLADEMRARMTDPSQVNAARDEKDKLTKERLSEAQGALKELMNRKQPRSKMPGAALPAPQAILPNPPSTSPNASPSVETAIPTPSPTPQ